MGTATAHKAKPANDAVESVPSTSDIVFPRKGRMGGRYGSALLKLGLVVIGSLFALILFEVLFRVVSALHPMRPTRSDRPAFYYAPQNSFRAQDYAYDMAKPEGTFRIAIIGDSFTYPTYLQFDDAFPKRLERMLNLNTAHGEHQRAEVLNFGRMGASTKSEVSLVKKALRYHPDLVLLEITLNDPEPKNFHEFAAKHPERYTSGELKIDAASHPFLSHWKSLVYLLARLHNARTYSSLLTYYDDVYNDTARWNQFSGALDEIQQLTANSGAHIGAVVFPFFYFPIDDRYPFQQLHNRIHTLLDEKKFAYTDLTESFAEMTPERLHIIVGHDSHPNEIAHRIAAESIYMWLEKQKLLPADLTIRRSGRRKVLRKHSSAPNRGIRTTPMQ